MFKMGKQDGNSPWFFQDAGTGWGEAGKANKVTLLPLDHTVALWTPSVKAKIKIGQLFSLDNKAVVFFNGH